MFNRLYEGVDLLLFSTIPSLPRIQCKTVNTMFPVLLPLVAGAVLTRCLFLFFLLQWGNVKHLVLGVINFTDADVVL